MTLDSLPSLRGEIEQRAEVEARNQVVEIAAAALLTEPTITTVNVIQRWMEAIRCVSDSKKFSSLTVDLITDIRKGAIKDISSSL